MDIIIKELLIMPFLSPDRNSVSLGSRSYLTLDMAPNSRVLVNEDGNQLSP